MYSIEDWNNTLALNAEDFRHFLCNNSIEEIGIPENMHWELFYEKMTEDNPFKMHKGSWPDIFYNWYRKDNTSTHNIGILASSLTNANDDFEFFNMHALKNGLWRIEDYYTSLKRKVLAVANSKSNKETPSKRYYNVAKNNEYYWKDNIIDLVDNEYIQKGCEAGLIDRNDMYWIGKVLKQRTDLHNPETLYSIVKNLGVQTMFSALNDLNTQNDTLDDLNQDNNTDIKKLKLLLLQTSKGIDLTHKGLKLCAETIKYIALDTNQFTSTEKKLVRKYLMTNNRIEEWSNSAKINVYNSFYTNKELQTLAVKKKEKMLIDSIFEYIKPEEIYGKEENLICARLFKIFKFSPIILDLLDNLNSQRITEIAKQHFKQFEPTQTISDLSFFD